MRSRLRHDLTAAIKAPDRTTTRALRSALSAIENAEAAEVIHEPQDPQAGTGSEYIAGSISGLCAAEVEGRALADSDVYALIQAQADERLLAAEEYERYRRGDLARQLRAEADVLRQYLHPSQ